MSWQQRLRDMVLAGGAGVLSVVGCGSGNSPQGTLTCCNVNPDPCCPSLECGGTVTAQCTEKMTCESDGGTWDYGGQQCSRLEDSGPDDAVGDVNFSFPCCNANPDPCCPSVHCGATVTFLCTEKMACESDGGTWDFTQSCVRDAGAHDAASDVSPAGPEAGADGNGQPD